MSERESFYYGRTQHTPPTDMSEGGLEAMICRALTGTDCMPRRQGEPAVGTSPPPPYGISEYFPGYPADYDREYCVDLAHLSAFLRATQPKTAEALDLDTNSNTRQQFLARLQGEISRRGVVDVLEREEHLYRGTVGVRDDTVVPFNIFRVHFRYNERDLGVHPPCRTVVNDNTT